MRMYAACLAIFVLLASLASAQETFVSGYAVEDRYLLLGEQYRSKDGGLHSFDLLPAPYIASIYHEMWHVWFIECADTQAPAFHDAFTSRALTLYPDIPEGKRVEVHEEAAAAFIDSIVQQTVQMHRFLAARSPDKRAEVRSGNPRYWGLYDWAWGDDYIGYYTKSIVGRVATDGNALMKQAVEDRELTWTIREDASAVLEPFIVSAAELGLPHDYLEQAAKALRGVVFLETRSNSVALDAEVVWATRPLGDIDRQLLREALLGPRVGPDTREVFSEQWFE